MSDKEPIVTLEHVCFGYNAHPVLEDVTLDIYEHDFLGLVGPNGGGKTTLLKLILGLLLPDSGRITVFGRSPQKARRMIGYVPHSLESDRAFPISALEVVLMGRLGHASLMGRYRQPDREAAEEALRSVELHELRMQRFGTLSQGQRQRVLIARALAAQARLLILDEPTASVDYQAEKGIYDLLRELNKRITLILVSHDLSLVSSYVTRLACLKRRLFFHPVCELSSDSIECLFGTPMQIVRHDRKFSCEEECKGR